MQFTKEDLEKAFIQGVVEGVMDFSSKHIVIERYSQKNTLSLQAQFDNWFYKNFVSELKDK